jgi:FO synthase
VSRADEPGPLDEAGALALLAAPTEELLPRAAARRDRRWGRQLTYSPKVFLPLTNLCRNVCDYCAFRRSPRDAGAHTMTPDEVGAQLAGARGAGCVEALFCLGDRPEAAFPSYRAQLAGWGLASTIDYLVAAARQALALGLLPHTNAGLLAPAELAALRPVNASLGLMLESASERLCGRGLPHHRAPDKRPARRLAMHDDAGALGIAFTSGILVGIGETPRERIEALLAIRAAHRRHRHVQEVIVQPFRAHPGTPMAGAPEPGDHELARTVAQARLILDDEVTVQVPPNLAPDALELLLAAGINDLGGISPVTRDFINPAHAWPHLGPLAARAAAAGFTLAPRLPVHDDFLHLVAPALRPHLDAARARLASARAA